MSNDHDHDAKYLKDITYPTAQSGVRYLTEQEEARERLKASVDALTQQASLQANMQKEPLKMLGGASAVGAVLGLMVGRQFKKTKKIYVDAGSPAKHQRELIKAQHQQKNSAGGALAATLGTLAFKMVMDKVITPKLEEVASGLLDKAGQPQSQATKPAPRPVSAFTKPAAAPAVAPAYAAPASAPATPPVVNVDFTAAPTTSPAASPVSSFLKPTHPGVVPLPASHVEAKAVGTPIAPDEQANPNAR